MKLDYLGRSWRTVKFELGHNEIDDGVEPELRIASDLVELFTELGLPAPGPVPVMRSDHQVAQKVHAVSEPDSERARDLVDLQLLDKGENLDLVQVNATCVRLFDYRRRQAWPPAIEVGAGWDDLYEAAIEGIGVLPDIGAAVVWANEFIARIADA
ncbi:nucleotidyl transferase AbiEii/AbiGii toxin family protein [Aeromicrobium sp.]|uniref:nucleotidyl transferase AbiEii/AbiGii toxin family protein n=1 Tax=Aeromicrobium sp. TaxID=1871063 RepID=UPI0019B47762|nr:nucleotidyl transferase AbiEii/AbiGii toxin family protein [Aeromicrobium sp.]MBC7632980.1 nucleotidyl transferase AbiEii/AbiGii toxin family protein [Aeromicrobium sp.]